MRNKPRILINYDYRQVPGTTGYYFEKALKDSIEFDVFRLGEDRIPCADVYLNIEPCNEIITYPGRLSAYYEIDNHINLGQKIERYNKVDYLFLAQKHFLNLYNHPNKHWLPLACDPHIHKEYFDEPLEYDVGFVGNDNYPERSKMLDLIGKNFKLLCTKAAPGEAYCRAFSKCKIAFNWAMDNDMNMRFFEAMSMGRMLITDNVEGQYDFFVPGRHYVEAKDGEDLIQKIKYYLDHPVERCAIAEAGQKLVHSRHTYQDRLYQILETMHLL